MFEVSEIVRLILSSSVVLTGVKQFPLIADQSEKTPFIVYFVAEEAAYSKAGLNDYTITIQSYHKTYNDAITLASKVKQAMAEATEIFKYTGANPEFVDQNLVRVTQNYQFKK